MTAVRRARPPSISPASAARAEMAESQVVDANPIINDAFREPTRYWHFGGDIPVIRDGRRTSGFLPPGGGEGELSITSDIVAIPLVNDIRTRVRVWRQDSYP